MCSQRSVTAASLAAPAGSVCTSNSFSATPARAAGPLSRLLARLFAPRADLPTNVT